MHTIAADSANEVWRQARLSLFSLSPSTAVQPSRAGDTRELLHVAMEVKEPLRRWVVSRVPPINPAFAIVEVIWILSGSNDASFLNAWNRHLPLFAGHAPTYPGAYGYRIGKYFGFDQLRRACEALRANPNSRQVVLQLWDASSDMPTSDGQPRSADVPCNVISLLKVRDGALHWTQIMRSNDLYRGLPYNMIQFTILQELLAGWLDLKLGSYHHWTDSLHAYVTDLGWFSADDCNEALSSDSLSLPFDEADELIRQMYERVRILGGDGQTALETVALIRGLPLGWQNMLWIVAAEAARRQGNREGMAAMISRCNNPSLQQVWARWFEAKVNRQVGPPPGANR